MQLSLRDFNRIVFFTGAGLSVESGLATYRGRGGIWHEYNYEEYACQAAFLCDPKKVWDFNELRRREVAGVAPNRGHEIIAEVQHAQPSTVIVTQNIDGLHQKAGATAVIELHGSLWGVRCDDCGIVQSDFDIPIHRRCVCGQYWRPDIVWFGDPLDFSTLGAASDALAACDLLVSVGTSAAVYPAAQLPVIAIENCATTIEINPEETPISKSYQHSMRMPASEALTLLWQ